MNIEKVIYSVLTTDAAVKAIVGTRVSPIVAPQSESGSYITYQEIDDPGFHNVDGNSKWHEARWQLNCWTADYDQTIILMKAVINALDDYTAIGIDHVSLDDKGDLPSVNIENESLTFYGKRMDFIFYYND